MRETNTTQIFNSVCYTGLTNLMKIKTNFSLYSRVRKFRLPFNLVIISNLHVLMS